MFSVSSIVQRKRKRVQQSFITCSYLHKHTILQYVHCISPTSPYVMIIMKFIILNNSVILIQKLLSESSSSRCKRNECTKVLPFLWSSLNSWSCRVGKKRRRRNVLFWNARFWIQDFGLKNLDIRFWIWDFGFKDKPSSCCWSSAGQRGSLVQGWSQRSASQSWKCQRRTCEPRERGTQTAGLSPSWRSGKPESKDLFSLRESAMGKKQMFVEQHLFGFGVIHSLTHTLTHMYLLSVYTE